MILTNVDKTYLYVVLITNSCSHVTIFELRFARILVKSFNSSQNETT